MSAPHSRTLRAQTYFVPSQTTRPRAGKNLLNRRNCVRQVVTRSQLSDQHYRGLLAELLACPHDDLPNLLQERDVCSSLHFLNWLAEHEIDVNGDEKAEIAALGGKLVAVREGLDPVPIEDVEREMQRQLMDKEAQSESLVPSQRKTSLLPLTKAGFAFIQKQVQKLEVENKDARGRSTTAVIGRKKTNGTDQQPDLDVADRILDVLMSMEGSEEMKAALVDAFTPDEPPPPLNLDFSRASLLEDIQNGTPPSEIDVDDILRKISLDQNHNGNNVGADSSEQEEDAEMEQLSTTPLQLLMAVNSRMKESPELMGVTLDDRLVELRTEILLHLKESTEG
ncbi:hypothetical protein BSKO_11222 [Bryopsis sp. KO-2023]|nr:hypothetical protein BSKO_11222 [Bryopsis sp. KO-2023]